MSIIFILVPFSIVLALCFFAAYAWCVGSGQYDDLDTPAVRVLLDDDVPAKESIKKGDGG